MSQTQQIVRSSTTTSFGGAYGKNLTSRHQHTAGEVETQSCSQCNSRDPLSLSLSVKSEGEIQTLKEEAQGFRLFKFFNQLRIQKFYHDQNEKIEMLLKPVEEHIRSAEEEQGRNQLRYRIAVHGSFAANLLLAVVQVYAAISSGSLSLYSTMADALFDPMSNVTLIISNRAAKNVNIDRYPSGKARIETVGNIVFSFIMTGVSAILIVLSVMELTQKSHPQDNSFHLPSIITVAAAFTVKFILFLYCYALRNKYSQIHILWEDHRNDLFVNAFGIMTSVGGSKLAWWIDPMGAIILSVGIGGLWLSSAYREFQLLIGVTADIQMHQWITYISMTHSPAITAIDTVKAYHSGPRVIVEVDVVMDRDSTLQAAHDIAEELQLKLESLPDVERAYVHIDYETTHKPEHNSKKRV